MRLIPASQASYLLFLIPDSYFRINPDPENSTITIYDLLVHACHVEPN